MKKKGHLKILLAGAISTMAAASFTRADAAEKISADEIKIITNVFASSVEFDKEGLCQAGGKTALRSWQVPGFPADIPHFESCTTLQAKTLRGEVEFSFTIQDRNGTKLQKINGVLELNSEGKASQAANWDHLHIPSAGTYYFVISIAGSEAKKIPMVFSLKKTGGKKRAQ